jgi:hypothetical protein
MSGRTSIRWTAGLSATLIVIGSVAARRHHHRGAGPADGEQTVVRCCAHHLFTTNWTPDSGFTVGRYGPLRFERCPVTRHWSLVTPVGVEQLTEEQREAAAAFHDTRLLADVR